MSEIINCPHVDQDYYAAGMCRNCYARQHRRKWDRDYSYSVKGRKRLQRYNEKRRRLKQILGLKGDWPTIKQVMTTYRPQAIAILNDPSHCHYQELKEILGDKILSVPSS
jgi:hypothetical protein